MAKGKDKIRTLNKTGVEIYKLILQNKLSRFPKYFWDKPESLEEAAKITQFLFETILGWTEDDIKEKASAIIFRENSLAGMLYSVFDGSPYKAIENSYPGKYKPWEFQCVPKNYWNKDTGREATKWLFEEKLKWAEKDIKEKALVETFECNGILGMLQRVFDNCPYKAIENAYPGTYKPWELQYAPKNYWNEDTGREAIKWLFEEKLKWTEEEIREKASKRIFKENGLGGMIHTLFNGNIYNAIKSVYP